MRYLGLTVLLVFGLLLSGGVPAPVVGEGSATIVQAQEPAPPAAPPVDIEVRDRAWYASPVWIAIGVLALVVVILLVAMAARGDGTTVVRD